MGTADNQPGWLYAASIGSFGTGMSELRSGAVFRAKVILTCKAAIGSYWKAAVHWNSFQELGRKNLGSVKLI